MIFSFAFHVTTAWLLKYTLRQSNLQSRSHATLITTGHFIFIVCKLASPKRLALHITSQSCFSFLWDSHVQGCERANANNEGSRIIYSCCQYRGRSIECCIYIHKNCAESRNRNPHLQFAKHFRRCRFHASWAGAARDGAKESWPRPGDMSLNII